MQSRLVNAGLSASFVSAGSENIGSVIFFFFAILYFVIIYILLNMNSVKVTVTDEFGYVLCLLHFLVHFVKHVFCHVTRRLNL